MNYSRALWFDFLPFYHMGVRASYKLNDQLTLNYWLVNGANQAEATNGFKDELFGFTATPRKTITWNVNYYLGQEHPDRLPVLTSGPLPVQPGLAFTAIRPAPDGRLHIFDVRELASYAEAHIGIGKRLRNPARVENFVGRTQALKETIATFDYKFDEGFLMRYEWRQDFSNQPSFLTDREGVLSKEQQTATVGVIWWVGRKEGVW